VDDAYDARSEARYDADDPREDEFRARREAVSDEGEDAP
jgi:hypothetical protein